MKHVNLTRFNVLISLIFLLATQTTWAKRFSNQYCEFELPSGWACALEGSEWVCQHDNEQSKKEAIIILAAKIKGPQDSLADYMSYLKQPKTFALPGGKTQISEPKYTNSKKVNDQEWIDSLHMASEVPGFYTRYLATIKEDLGIAVTFSVAKDFYQAYAGLFDKIVASLRVFRQQKKEMSNFRIKKDEERNFADNATFVPEVVKHDLGKKVQKGSGGNAQGEMILYGLGALVVVVIFILKNRKKKPKAKKKK